MPIYVLTYPSGVIASTTHFTISDEDLYAVLDLDG